MQLYRKIYDKNPLTGSKPFYANLFNRELVHQFAAKLEDGSIRYKVEKIIGRKNKKKQDILYSKLEM